MPLGATTDGDIMLERAQGGQLLLELLRYAVGRQSYIVGWAAEVVGRERHVLTESETAEARRVIADAHKGEHDGARTRATWIALDRRLAAPHIDVASSWFIIRASERRMLVISAFRRAISERDAEVLSRRLEPVLGLLALCDDADRGIAHRDVDWELHLAEDGSARQAVLADTQARLREFGVSGQVTAP